MYFLHSREIDLVLDVGANVGQYAKVLRGQGYAGRIRSFEPVGSAYAGLARAAATDTAWETHRTAVGAAIGTAVINVSQNTVFSSIKTTTDRAALFDGSSAVASTETVAVTTIDAAMAGDGARRVFLKIDTQGFERDVMAGAAASLARCAGLQLELPIEHLYHDVWSMREALDFVGDAGFVPAQVRFVAPLDGDPASAMELDWVFRRR